MNNWSIKKLQVVTGVAAFAVLALLALVAGRVTESRPTFSLGTWAPVVAAMYAVSFARSSNTIVGYRKRTTLPSWLVGPWLPLAFGPVKPWACFLYYVPMAVGFVAGVVEEGRRDTARAVVLPGLKWVRVGDSITVEVPNGAFVREHLLASKAAAGVLLRGERDGGDGAELDLYVSLDTKAYVIDGQRLTVAVNTGELASWNEAPLQWTLRVTEG